MNYSFIDPTVKFPFPKSFDYQAFLEVEQEINMIIPEIGDRQANFIQFGLSSLVLVQCADDRSELGLDETYFLAPQEDGYVYPVRMKVLRHLTLDEFRMLHHTTIRLSEFFAPLVEIYQKVADGIFGNEILKENRKHA